ncbi:MAG: LCP family protein, partial [Anaerolineae bacterium]|nr:LCP family protein [Anaerolineae bacterium]
MQNPSAQDDQQTVVNNRPVYIPSNRSANLPPAPTMPNTPPVQQGYYNQTLPPAPSLQESAARERMRRRRVNSRSKGGEWAWVVIAAAIFGIVMVMGLSGFILLRASQSTQEVMPTAVIALPTPIEVANASGLQTGQQITLSDGRNLTLSAWDGQSRFTVLIVGLDRRPGETGLAYRTDTMMLVSIDPTTKTLGILSIPRDLFVSIPGYSEPQRINTPMVLGELQRPGYGPDLMQQTVQYNFGIRVHDYVAIDFNTFITIVDAVGGIDLDVPYAISDTSYPDMNYGYDPFYIKAGLQHLDGKTALKYARTRHGDSDFNRAERQQAVLYAIRDRVLSLNMMPQLIAQSPTIWNAISSGVSTGLTFDQIIQLVWYLKDVDKANIKTGVVDNTYTM